MKELEGDVLIVGVGGKMGPSLAKMAKRAIDAAGVQKAVRDQEEIDLTTGNVNVIWQGDTNDWALRSLSYTSVPPKVLNVTGPETLSVRWIAEEFGRRLGIEPRFRGMESPDALLSNASFTELLQRGFVSPLLSS